MTGTNNGEFDWSACVEPARKKISEFSEWRGLPACEWLIDQRLIGITDGLWSFPVHNLAGHVIAAHVRKAAGGWFYKPATSPQLFPIGNLTSATAVHLFESQFDMITVMTVLELYLKDNVASAATRGATNAKLIKGRIPQGCEIYAYPQNDSAGEKWLDDICAYAGREVNVVRIPGPEKDVNDWIKNGAGKRDLEKIIGSATVTYEDGPRELSGISIVAYSELQINGEDTLLGDRYLCRGGGLLIAGPSGQGKSVMSVQMTIEIAAGRASFGIQVPKPLRILDIQAEDDSGDLIEMAQIVKHLKLTDDERQRVSNNSLIETLNDLTGDQFVDALDSFLNQWPADIVKINPFSSYLGSDVRDDKAVTRFLRNKLNPVLYKHRAAVIIFCHTPKTNFRDTSNWNLYDWMYSAAGSATLTNWARAFIAFEPTDATSVYQLIAAKRGKRIGWPNSVVYYAHSPEPGQLLWLPANRDQIAAAKESAKKKPDDLLALIPKHDPISQEELLLTASASGFGRDKTREFVNILIDQQKAFTWKLPRPGKKPGKGYAQRQEPESEQLECS